MYTISPMSITDYDDAVALWLRTEGMSLELEDVDAREQVARYLERNAGMSFVARTEDRLVGAVMCGHDGRRGYLHHLAIDREYRRLGIGSALVACCLAALHADGISRCNIFVLADNECGRRFWEEHGWSIKPNPRLQIATKRNGDTDMLQKAEMTGKGG